MHAQGGWVAADGEDSIGESACFPKLDEVRAAAAADLGLVLVPRDTPPERLRGLREGWVHWWVGSPIVHPETAERFLFDEGCGRIVPLAQIA